MFFHPFTCAPSYSFFEKGALSYYKIKKDPNLYGTWVGGAISLEKIKEILRNIGFRDIEINLKEVTDEYARKWGHGLMIKEYIGSGDILAFK